MERKYNYVLVIGDTENIEVMYKDFDNFEGCQLLLLKRKYYKSTVFDTFLLSKKIPFFLIRNMVYDLKKYFYIKKHFASIKKDIRYLDNGKKNCFIVYARDFEYFGRFFLRVIKRYYPDAYFVCYFGDVVSSFYMKMRLFRKNFSKLFSFDLHDCTQENMIHIQEPFSFYNFTEKSNAEYDVMFVGAAKDRLVKILNVYKVLRQKGFKTDFHIVGVRDTEQLFADDIVYNKPLNYKEVLQHVIKSRCVLEILQKNASSPTTRYSEALIFNKFLITDCAYFKDRDDIPENVIYFDQIKDIDWSKLNTDLKNVNPKFLKELSVGNFIEIIDSNVGY